MKMLRHRALGPHGLELAKPTLKLFCLQMCTNSVPSQPLRNCRASVAIYPGGLFVMSVAGWFGQGLFL